MAIENEYRGADLGDKRLGARLLRLADSLVDEPDASFPTALKSEGELEAAYRFLSNERVTPEKILEPHLRASAKRAEKLGRVIVAHDTTDLSFSTEREDLGWLNSGGHGVLAHVAIGVSADGRREPVGVLGLHTWVRRGKRKSRQKQLTRRKRNLAKHRESDRWGELIEKVSGVLGDAVEAIHVMDREADSFPLLAALKEKKRRFVIRLRTDRRLSGGEGTLREALPDLEGQLCREVQLSRRVKPSFPRAPMRPREERSAKLVIAAGSFTFRRPDNAPFVPESALTVGVVHVRELQTPAGCEPVEWILLTSEPIETAEQIENIVDAYRARWCIEEFFKALKTGCAIEKRQLESLHALCNALALFLPIAWDLFRLRSIARDLGGAPASAVLNALQIRILKAEPRAKFKDHTARGAMLAIARLGGHLARNGEPGWQVLGRGLEFLLALEHGARLVRAQL